MADVTYLDDHRPEAPEPNWPALMAQLRGARDWLWHEYSINGNGQDEVDINYTAHAILPLYEVVGLAADMLVADHSEVAELFRSRTAEIAMFFGLTGGFVPEAGVGLPGR